jgi:thioesterase domain-containing protein
VIAAEMSRTIVARGGDVQFLGLLDSRAPIPQMRERPIDRASLARTFLQYMTLTRERALAAPPAGHEARELLEALRAAGIDAIGDESELERRFAMYMAVLRLFFHHEQHPVPVPIHLFEAAEAHPSHPKPPSLGWDDLAPRLERFTIAGTHFSLMSPSRVPALAAALDAVLRVDSDGRPTWTQR